MSDAGSKPRVVLLRGHSANLWDLRPYERLAGEYDVSILVTGSNLHQLDGLDVTTVPARSVRDRLPGSRAAGAIAYALGERYVGLRDQLAGADIVHSAEIGTWFSAQAAELREELGFKLVLTIWETLPWGDTYRWPRERRYRRATLPAVDLFLPATERARCCLLLEGAASTLIEVCPPGIELERFRLSEASRPANARHVVLSVGRLVWEKGHQDVLRAVAALRAGLDGLPVRDDVTLIIVGDGPEGKRLQSYAAELGIDDAVEFRNLVLYDEMAALYARASSLVLASLPVKAWEEQFGMVLAEAMAAGLPIVASASGAIPEVVSGQASLFEPGDWAALAGALAEGPLAGAPGERRAYDGGLLDRYSAEACAGRLRTAYDRVLGNGG